jgi:two-component system cell cycle response regulator
MMECCTEIDLIICDIKLGNASGIDLVKTLKKSGRFSSTPIVAVTAGSLGQSNEAFAAGFDRYILKPIEAQTFVAQVTDGLIASGDAGLGQTAKISAAPVLDKELHDNRHSTILAVDDRSANLDLVGALLEPAGYRVITARGVEEALVRARNDHPDLILTDVHMGDGTGFDLIRAIRNDVTLRDIPWFVTSATYLNMDGRAEDLHLDDSNFILQPWEPREFLAKIQNRLTNGNGLVYGKRKAQASWQR